MANTSRNDSRMRVRYLSLTAVLIAVSIVLNQIKFLHLPMGGSITLFSIFAATLIGYFCGPKWGFTGGLALGLLNLAFGGYILVPVQVFLDYFLAFGLMGVSGFFRNMKYGLSIGFIAGAFMKFLASSISGFVFFAEYAPDTMNPVVYSVAYNGICIGGEVVLTLVLLAVPAVRKAIYKLKGEF